MVNYYSTINEVVMTFSNIEKDSNDFETITAKFERPADCGFNYSEWELPHLFNAKSYGFSETEILEQERYLRNNMLLIWEIARERGADAIA